MVDVEVDMTSYAYHGSCRSLGWPKMGDCLLTTTLAFMLYDFSFLLLRLMCAPSCKIRMRDGATARHTQRGTQMCIYIERLSRYVLRIHVMIGLRFGVK